MIIAGRARQNLLIVDDERGQLQTLSDIFADDGFAVCACGSFEEAIDCCQRQSFAVAVLDLRLRGRDGIELLDKVRQSQPGIRTIVHTAYGSFDSAKDALNLGAFAYVEKRGDPGELVSQVHRAVEDLLTEALTQSERRLRDLLDNVSAIVWECELPGRRFMFVSQQAENVLGYPLSQWLEEPDFWIQRIHEDDRDRCLTVCQQAAASGQDHEIDYRVIASDGRIVWIRDVVRVVCDESGRPTHLRGVMLDVTDKKLAEERLCETQAQLAHVSRLSTMGEMVAGIAHEINQPLAAISNFATASHMAITNLDVESKLPLGDWLKQIGSEAVRCGEIIRQLRTYARKGDQQWEVVDLNFAIDESIALLGSDTRFRAESIQVQRSGQKPVVQGSRVQLQQVFVNLLRNACDAIENCGKPSIEIQLSVVGDTVRVAITDNGPGIKDDQRRKLFDPFYTTKDNGMGIGLSISKSIVETHHGSLALDSSANSGARFVIELPLKEDDSADTQLQTR